MHVSVSGESKHGLAGPSGSGLSQGYSQEAGEAVIISSFHLGVMCFQFPLAVVGGLTMPHRLLD